MQSDWRLMRLFRGRVCKTWSVARSAWVMQTGQQSRFGGLTLVCCQCAGPQKMVESVVLACSSRNDALGLCGTPYLDVKQYTYSL